MHGERGHFFNSFKVSPSPIKVAVEEFQKRPSLDEHLRGDEKAPQPDVGQSQISVSSSRGIIGNPTLFLFSFGLIF